MTKFGFTALDKTGYAVRAYIAKSTQDAERAAEIELGPSFGRLIKVPLNVVKYPMQSDRHLEPADLTTNYGWSELTPWEA